MNSIAGFRLCKLNGEDLIKKVDEHTDNIYKQGRIPDRHIPARPEQDFDLLVGELMLRFKEIKELVEACLSEDPKDEALLKILNILEGKIICQQNNCEKKSYIFL